MSDGVTSCRYFIRSETKAVHKTTDAAMTNHADVADQEGYQRFLQIMHNVVSRFGAQLDAACEAAELPARSEQLLQHLVGDFHDGGGAIFEGGLLPPGDAFEVQTHRSFHAGVGYALEGSSLGAEVLRRRAVEAQPKAATAYFDALLDGRKDRWLHYCDWLDDNHRSAEQRQQAVLGASAVFTFVGQCINQKAHPYP